MKKILLLLSSLISIHAFAQLPEDALRSAWFTQNGSARSIAVGGVMASLGGDISAAHVNPAGLGLYKTREVVISPGLFLNNNKLNYRGTDSANHANNMAYGTSGIVLGTPARYKDSKWTSSAFSFTVNELASYNNHIQFSGFNNMSSFSEQYLEELVRDRADTNAALSNYIFGSSLAFRTFLIDTLTGPGGTIAGYKSMVPISTGVMQSYDATTRGGYHEVALGFAGNMADKLYLGASVTIPIVSYSRDLVYTEKDAINDPNNNFSYFTYKESFTSTGYGVGMKLGMIYKPKEFWRVGFAFHTPQFISFTDEIRSSIEANTESYAGLRKETSDNLNSGNPGTRKYDLLTPWRAIASASYVFRQVENTHKQRAFLSADIEYVNYRGARFSIQDKNDATGKAYLQQVNSTLKDYYKGNVNIKLGGELKFDPWMFRLGGAYYGSPYASSDIKADRLVLSSGVGYRNHGIFIDLTYAYTFVKDAVFPYYLADKPNTFAEENGNKGTVLLTFGFKF
ncbi:MAG: outer membrane protein transport protein [Bacteroidota bacterium]|nr:outer membrane protein transport protein [Bacteroidota bacterium]